MPARCCVPGCKSNYRDSKEYVSVYSFPKDEELIKKWCEAIGRCNWMPSKYSTVCRNHFHDNDIISNVCCYDDRTKIHITMPLSQTRLKDSAVPSVFDNLFPIDPISKRIIRKKRVKQRKSRREARVVFPVNEDKLDLLKKRVTSMINELGPDDLDNVPKKVHLRKMLGFLGVVNDAKKGQVDVNDASMSVANECTEDTQHVSSSPEVISGSDEKKQQNMNDTTATGMLLAVNKSSTTAPSVNITTPQCTNCKLPHDVKKPADLQLNNDAFKSKSMIRPGMVPSKITLRIVNALQQIITSNCNFKPASVITVKGSSKEANMVVVKSSSGSKENESCVINSSLGLSGECSLNMETDSVNYMEDANDMVLYITKEVVDEICSIYNNIDNYEPVKSCKTKSDEFSKFLQITKHLSFYVTFVENGGNEGSSTCVISTNPMTELSITCTYKCNRPFENQSENNKKMRLKRISDRKGLSGASRARKISKIDLEMLESPENYNLRRKRVNYKMLVGGKHNNEDSDDSDSDTALKSIKSDITPKRKQALPLQKQHKVKKPKLNEIEFVDMRDRIYIDTDKMYDEDDILLYHRLIAVNKNNSKINTIYSSKNPPKFEKEIRIVLEKCDQLFIKESFMKTPTKTINVRKSNESHMEETIANIKMFIDGNFTDVSSSTCSINNNSFDLDSESLVNIKTEINVTNNDDDNMEVEYVDTVKGIEDCDQVTYKNTDLVANDISGFGQIFINDVKTIANFDDSLSNEDVSDTWEIQKDDISDNGARLEKELMNRGKYGSIEEAVSKTHKDVNDCNVDINENDGCKEQQSNNDGQEGSVQEQSIFQEEDEVNEISDNFGFGAINETINIDADEIIVDVNSRINEYINKLPNDVKDKSIKNKKDESVVTGKSKDVTEEPKKCLNENTLDCIEVNELMDNLNVIDKSSNDLKPLIVNKGKGELDDTSIGLEKQIDKTDENKKNEELINEHDEVNNVMIENIQVVNVDKQQQSKSEIVNDRQINSLVNVDVNGKSNENKIIEELINEHDEVNNVMIENIQVVNVDKQQQSKSEIVNDRQINSLVNVDDNEKSMDINLDTFGNIDNKPLGIVIAINVNDVIEDDVKETSNNVECDQQSLNNTDLLAAAQNKSVEGFTNSKPCEEQISKIVNEATFESIELNNVILQTGSSVNLIPFEEALRKLDESDAINNRLYEITGDNVLHEFITLHSKDNQDNIIIKDNVEILHKHIDWITEESDEDDISTDTDEDNFCNDDIVLSNVDKDNVSINIDEDNVSSNTVKDTVPTNIDQNVEEKLNDVVEVVKIDDEYDVSKTFGKIEYVIKLDDHYTMIKDGVLTKADFREVEIKNEDDVVEVEIVTNLDKRKKKEKKSDKNKMEMIKCNICFKKIYLGSYRRHMVRHLGVRFCPHCSKSFKHYQMFREHVETHKNGNPTGKERYECKICSRRFCFLKNMCKHLKSAHPGSKEESSIVVLPDNGINYKVSKLNNDDGKVKCDHCELRVKRHYYKRHLITHTGERPFACHLCNKRFPEKATLKNHMRVHTLEKPFVCNVCDKSFNHSSTLSKHRNIHTGDKRYICEICGKELSSGYNLRCHRRSHTGEKPFACELCPLRFSFKSSMQKHMVICSSR